jgi:hypothetical protein
MIEGSLEVKLPTIWTDEKQSSPISGLTLVCFVHFDLEMCFEPQRRALFQHLNFQKWSEAEVFFTFCFAPQWRAPFHLSSGLLAPLPPL